MTPCHRCGHVRRDDARFCENCGAARGVADELPPVRKHVIVLFVDIVGSTSLGEQLDPESLRAYLKRYFDEVSRVLWRHGGTVEKFIGDAVMAVFGVPIAHENDAAAALAAAAELHEAARVISTDLEREYGQPLRLRIGINGGDVYVSRNADGQYSVTGDVVNVAARLEQLAQPSTTVVGGTVPKLAGAAAALVAMPPMPVRGRNEPVPVWRVGELPGVPETASEPTFVGRDEELNDLHRVARRAITHQDAWLVTVSGSAGIGKSRLVAEFVKGVAGARQLVGHCLSVGSGAAFWPLAQMLRQLGRDWRADVTMLFEDRAEAELVVERLSTAIGQGQEATTVDDIVWAMRRAIEVLSRGRPLIVVWEDLHWAEPALVDALRRLAGQLTGVPVVMVCVARPEFLEDHPNWGGGRVNSVAIRMSPLDDSAIDSLVGELARHDANIVSSAKPSSELVRVKALSDGNPLILQEMLNTVADKRELPVTVQTLFEARLDRLDAVDRFVCECAAAVGREFWGDLVRSLSGIDMPHSVWHETLDRLARLDLVRPTRLSGASGPTHRFVHTLFMETAYRNTPKRERSRRHRAIAEWLARSGIDDGPRCELIAFHLERAHTLLAQVSPGSTELRQLAVESAAADIEASAHCIARADVGAAIRLLTHARDLLPPGDHRHIDIAYRLVDCYTAVGLTADAQAALDAADQALTGVKLWARLGAVPRAAIRLREEPADPSFAHLAASRALQALRDDESPVGSLLAYELQALAFGLHDQFDRAEQALRSALECARRAQDLRGERRLQVALCEVAFWGTTPVGDALELCRKVASLVANDSQLTAGLLAVQASLHALAGDDLAAAQRIDQVRAITSTVLMHRAWAGLSQFSSLVAILNGRPGDAVAELLSALPALGGGAGADNVLLAARAMLAAGTGHGHVRELLRAHSLEQGSPHLGMPNFRALWCGLQARLMAMDGDVTAARAYADQAVMAAASVENPRLRGDAHLDKAIALRLLGERGAAECAEEARRQYRAKGAHRCEELVTHAVPD